MNKLIILTLTGLILLQPALQAQEKCPVKFGKVLPADFSLPAGSYDTSADAVIIADVGSSEFVGNSSGWFTLEFRHSRRMKILNKRGFSAANVEIPLWVSGNVSEKVMGLKATTYNMEDGKVVETRLDDKSVFTDKISKHVIEKKFTFPALKDGSIVEYTYLQTSEFPFNLQPWEFQGQYPCLWSEYNVAMPDFFQYANISQGYLRFDINSTASRNVRFHIVVPGSGGGRNDLVDMEQPVVDHRWVVKNVPALKEESYTTTLNNFIQKIEFQLARYNFPNTFSQDLMGNWFTVTEALLKDDDFGADLDSHNGWMDDDMKIITKGVTTPLQKAQKIYAYIRDNFTCTYHSGLYSSQTLKTTFKNKSGTTPELNLLLTAMLHHEKIEADPVILSTRQHGFTNTLYPMLDRFNYVVSRAYIDSTIYYLDASDRWRGFGRLPEKCYNGYSRVISHIPDQALLFADSVVEGKITLAIISMEGKGAFAVHVQSKPGYFEASGIREKVQDKGKQDFLKSIQTGYSSDALVSNLSFDSLKLPEEPLAVEYDVKINIDSTTDLIYFNPLLSEGYKENPFKAAQRFYPVEMPYVMDETYIMTMEVPEGYAVDEIPKSARVKYNDDEGSFEYLVVHQGDQIQLRSRIRLQKANFTPEDYSSLRDFFGYVVKKQSEQIVFKKKKVKL